MEEDDFGDLYDDRPPFGSAISASTSRTAYSSVSVDDDDVDGAFPSSSCSILPTPSEAKTLSVELFAERDSHEDDNLRHNSMSCPICLGPISGKAFLDPCYHCFCFQCILQWCEMVSTHPSLVGETFLECPLCKTRSSCIIHNIVLDTFQRYYPFDSKSSSRKQFSLSPSHFMRRYMYRHNLHGATQEKFRQKTRIKRKNLCITTNKHVRPWVERELQALLHEEDVNIIGQHVVGVLEHLEKQQKKGESSVLGTWKASMVETVRPFICENAEMFVEELEIFLCAGLAMEAYDKLAEEVVQDHVLQKI